MFNLINLWQIIKALQFHNKNLLSFRELSPSKTFLVLVQCVQWITNFQMEMYCDVVPVYHSESLRQFPQISAITHNNFFYLGHECLTLGLVS